MKIAALCGLLCAGLPGTQIGLAQNAIALRNASVRPAPVSQKVKGTRSSYVTSDGAHVLPYVLNGANWYTNFVFTNLENKKISVGCEFVAPNGDAIELSLTFGKGDGMTLDIDPFDTFTFRTTEGTDKLVTAWIYCSADPRTDRYFATTVLRNESATISARDFTIPILPDEEPRFVVPYLQTDVYQTALVLVNTATEGTSTVKLSFYSYGAAAGSTSITLKPGELQLNVLNKLFPVFPRLDAGSIFVEVTDGTTYITGVALRAGGPGGSIAFPPMAEAPPPDAQ